MSSTRSTSTTQPAAARRLWRASVVTTQSAPGCGWERPNLPCWTSRLTVPSFGRSHPGGNIAALRRELRAVLAVPLALGPANSLQPRRWRAAIAQMQRLGEFGRLNDPIGEPLHQSGRLLRGQIGLAQLSGHRLDFGQQARVVIE